MTNNEKCYMCNRYATSNEHVPPKCLFPEKKDTRGINFRKELITVPSCDIHNLLKSDDDEFLMLSLSGLLKNNPIGSFHQRTKANRALKRKNKNFIEKEILRNHRLKTISTPKGKTITVSFGNPNNQRLNHCLEHIAFGLYYHEFKKTFEGELRLILEFLEYEDENIQTFKKFLKERFAVETELNTEFKGENPEVFYYQFHKPDEFGLIGMKMVFYGTAEVYCSFKSKEAKEPINLGMNLIDKGIKTIITVGDKEFVFNK
ncbi:hypothetical protein GCQ56_19045 [Marinifilum sp. N1E240]|uniref:hypothetical protein n=1 Tax=Marinifilum sp. N1E240 TaxID=2608082 RepID=UPI00128B27DC|nr:hypothetical protein [Marinifilum sp. N1E240]MPQ49101.1 hypothetical protein [Marinifilum sp. N1E240]